MHPSRNAPARVDRLSCSGRPGRFLPPNLKEESISCCPRNHRVLRISFSDLVSQHDLTENPYPVFQPCPRRHLLQVQTSCSNPNMPGSYPRFRDHRAREFQTGIAECGKWPRILVGQCFEEEMLISLKPNNFLSSGDFGQRGCYTTAPLTAPPAEGRGYIALKQFFELFNRQTRLFQDM